MWFKSQHRVDALNRIALSWLGTPFHPNAMIKGGGVSCQKLFGAIMIECGVLPQSIEIDSGPVSWNSKQPLIEQGMDIKLATWFENVFGVSVAGVVPVASVEGCTGTPFQFMPGDAIGFDVGGVVRHIGVCLNDDMFVHVLRHSNVTTSLLRDATWCSRVKRVWRAKG